MWESVDVLPRGFPSQIPPRPDVTRSALPRTLPTNQRPLTFLLIDFDSTTTASRQSTNQHGPPYRCLTMRYSRLALAAALGALASPETACAFQHNPNAKRSVAATAAAAVGSSSSTSFASIVDDRQRRSKNLPSLVWGQRRRAAPLLFSTAAPAETAEAASDAKETYEFTVRQPCYRHLA
jgi:hypothetical protein